MSVATSENNRINQMSLEFCSILREKLSTRRQRCCSFAKDTSIKTANADRYKFTVQKKRMSFLLILFVKFIFVAAFLHPASNAEKLSGFFMLKKKEYRLKNSFLRSITAENELICAHYCSLESSLNSKCKSFNYITDPTIHLNCELNSKVAESAEDQNLVSSSRSRYFEILATNEGVPSTCSAIKLSDSEKSSGYYTIQPKKNEVPFIVFCNMTDEHGVGVTVFGHDSEERTHVSGYEEKGSYIKSITYYNATMKQIENVINASIHCKQFIKYECTGTLFQFQSLEGAYSWWVSRQGYKMLYWGGSTPSAKSCACGISGTCLNSDEVCNCENASGWTEDRGYLVDKKYLPVSELRFGDTGYSNEEGYHTLGKLLCWG